MKIYFENGRLLPKSQLPFQYDFFINAGNGYSACEHDLNAIRRHFPDSVVYTNMITALSNSYAWNSELKAPEIYMRDDSGEFTRIDKLAKGPIRYGQNVMSMYRAGVFGNVPVVVIK